MSNATASSDSGKLLPYSLAAEASLLGAMILDKLVIGEVIQVLPRADLLHRSSHQVVFQTLVELYDAAGEIDLVILKEELKNRGQLEGVGGTDYLVQLAESVPSAANATYYAQIVKDKAIQRELIQICDTFASRAYSGREKSSELLDEAETAIMRIADDSYSGQVSHIHDLLKEEFEKLTGGVEHLSGARTGFVELDEMLNGMHAGEFLILAARPSVGKTALLLNIMEHVAVDYQSTVLMFSLEMSDQQIAQRLISIRGQINSHELRRGRLPEREFQRIAMVCDALGQAPILIDDTPGLTAMQLRAKARRAKMQHDVKLVMIDYLQLMSAPQAARESRQQEVSEISRGLKALARELNVPVLAAAQLNRGPEGRTNARPVMSDLRESGSLEQDADVVMLLHRHDYQKEADPNAPPPLTELIVAKQRNGPTGKVDLMFKKEYGRFDPVSMVGDEVQVPI